MNDYRDRELTADEIHDRVEWLKQQARDGANALHSRATHADKKQKTTPVEELARARARADREASR